MISKILNAVIVSGVLFCFSINSYGQKVRTHYEKLKKIQEEINSVKKVIAANKEKESSLTFLLTNLDLDIDVKHSLIQKLRKEQKQKEKEIKTIERRLHSTEKDLKKLTEIMGKRLVYFYKYGRLKDIELLLSAHSINQGLLWVEYQKRLTGNDYRNYLKIKKKKASIAQIKNLLTKELKKKRTLIKELLSEKKALKTKKSQRQAVLASIRKDTQLFRQQLAAKERARAEMTQLITNIENTPTETPLLPPNTPFAEMQGRMIWPTKGKIVAKFGRFKHPQLKTVTENIGIDIEAKIGTAVQVVAGGRVTRITWQRGMGNIIIVKHYGGFYTVYTHLKEILVNEAQNVQMGDVIGNVGESGSLEGPRLHFEVWKGTEKLNPEKWLAVRS
ncbi:MAG: murein hydrolase activator EnvC family protein [bacterium]